MIHAGDKALGPILRALDKVYSAPMKRTEERLRTFIEPKNKALQPRKNESVQAYRRRLLVVFSGPRWTRIKQKIAEDFSGANDEVIERVNDSLEQAFADGLNDSAYHLAQSGAEAWPITVSIVAGLVAAGIIALNTRTLKKSADVESNARRTQSAVNGAIARDVSIDDMAKDIAKHIASNRQNAMIAYARAAIYGASDYGAFMAGEEAQKAGIKTEKTWMAIMDMRVRPSHKNLHGVTLPLNKKFKGLYGPLMYPHDPNALPQETYRCRCRMVVHLAGNAPDEYSRFILPTETAAYHRWRDKQIRKAGGELELAKIHRRLMG